MKLKNVFIKHNYWIIKVVACLFFALTIFSTLTACNSIENPNADGSITSTTSNSYVAKPNKSSTSKSSQVSTAPKSSKSSSKSSVAPSSSAQNPIITTPNTTEYSDLLFHLLINDEANAKIDSALEDPSLFQSAEFDSHPYTFLKNQGHDVENVKAGNLKCRTVTMVENDDPNSLYMAVMVENAGEIPYYTQYMLKYSLTQQEMQDYKMLYSDQYYQSYFINDQISKEKAAEIVSQTKIAVETQEDLESRFKKSLPLADSTLGTNAVNIMLANFDESTSRFTIHIFSNLEDSSNPVYTNGKISTSSFKSTYTNDNNIFLLSSNAKLSSKGQDIIDCKANIKATTVFYNQIFDITANADKDLENTINSNNNVEDSSNSNLEDSINSGV